MEQRNLFAGISGCRSAIMGAAALWIWVFHQWTPVLGGIPVLSLAETFGKDTGFAGVDIFFFLSGMGLMFSRQDQGLLVFYRRRLLRVWVPFFLTGIAVALAEGWGLGLFVGNVTGWQFLTVSLYSFLWFVPAIVLLYLLFPAYRSLLQKTPGKIRFTVLAIALWLGLSLAGRNAGREDLYLFTNRIPIFLTGVLAGWAAQNGDLPWPRLGIPVCLGLLGLGFALAWLTGYRQMPLLVPMALVCIPGFLIALGAVGLLSRVLCRWKLAPVRRVLDFYGNMSLEFYCVQEWLGEMLHSSVLGQLPPLIRNLLDFAAATCAALALQGLCRLLTRRKGAQG